MKSKTVRLVLVLGFISIAINTKAQFYGGIVGGLSVPDLSAAGNENNPLNSGYSSRFGPEAGLYGSFSCSKLFSIEAKVLYSSQGGKKNGFQAFPTPSEFAQYYQAQGAQAPPYLYANYKSEARIDYLRIPVLAKFGWKLSTDSHFSFSVAAGPFGGLLLSAKQVTTGNSDVYADAAGTQPLPVGSQSFNQTTSLKDQLHSFNVGIDGNIGLAYSLGTTGASKLFFEAGGNYGFINIQKGDANGKNNTGAATLLLGYAYRFGKL